MRILFFILLAIIVTGLITLIAAKTPRDLYCEDDFNEADIYND